ncbi:MAG: TetR/AcrR family transcriptional regulator [Proteobacteria bacterium]|nr:TetR/AcrR family transcriptional regulator [Pseudomonadota bacterium]
MNRVGTQKKILDAAEKLLAHNGYHATTLRAITAEAGVNVAAVNYHFGSKEALLDNVIERRIVPLNSARMEMLESVRADALTRGRRPSVRDLMHAFVAPTISFRDSGKGARNFIALVGRTLGEPPSAVQHSFFRFMEPFIKLMLGSLKEALPELSDDLLLLRFHLSVGMLVYTIRMADESDILGQTRALSDIGNKTIGKSKGGSGVGSKAPAKRPVDTANTTEKLVDEVVNFMTAGMEA